MDSKETPLWNRLKSYVKEEVTPYHMPGHKQGRGVHRNFSDFVGLNIFKIDLTEVEGLDNLHRPTDVIARSQQLTAAAFGAEESFFLVNGATAGLEALLLSFNPGDKIIVPRNMHRSILNGFILSGAEPVYIWPEYDPNLGLVLPVQNKELSMAIAGSAKAKGVFLLNPTYHGISPNIQKDVQTVKSHGLLAMVDEAHGPHFHFHPRLPDSAAKAKADAWVHGAHKIIGAMTQAAYLHLGGKDIDRQRVVSALQIMQTTSPSYILMASLDMARMQMATQGYDLLGKAMEIACSIRKEVNKIQGLYCFDQSDLDSYGDLKLDPTKININVSRLGLKGFEVMQLLREKYGIQAEMANAQSVLFMVTIGDNPEMAGKLIFALKEIAGNYYPANHQKTSQFNLHLPKPQMAVPPREAWQSRCRQVTLNESLGKICAEAVVPYPPGIPLICPGERIDEDVLAAIKNYRKAGFLFQGVQDNSLSTIKVLA